MNAVTYKHGTPGYRCGACDAVFREDAAGSCREAAISEAWGAREVRDENYLECPECGGWDLDEIHLCTECETTEAFEDGRCGCCAPPVLEPDFPQADLDALAEGNFRRDKGAAA